jgi:hypothetical protein
MAMIKNGADKNSRFRTWLEGGVTFLVADEEPRIRRAGVNRPWVLPIICDANIINLTVPIPRIRCKEADDKANFGQKRKRMRGNSSALLPLTGLQCVA